MARLRQIGALTLLLAGPAGAADLRGSLPAMPVAAEFCTWSGLYAGVQAGNSWDADRTTEFYTAGRTPTGVAFDFHPDTAVGGGHLGAAYQFGPVVIGVEGDGEAVNARGGFNDPGGRNAYDPGGVGRVRRYWQASARGRLGYAFDRVLVYGTGGAAFTEFDYYYYNPVARGGEGFRTTRTGWTAGAGISYAMTDHMIVGLEYRRTDYGRFDNVARSAFLGLTGQQEPVMNTVRASLSYKY